MLFVEFIKWYGDICSYNFNSVKNAYSQWFEVKNNCSLTNNVMVMALMSSGFIFIKNICVGIPGEESHRYDPLPVIRNSSFIMLPNLHEEFSPPEELRDSIKCFWYDRKEYGEKQTTFKVMPDGYAEIIFYFGMIKSVSQGNEHEPLPSPFIMGLLDRPVSFYTSNRLEIIGIRCFPWTVFDLLGLQADRQEVHKFEHPIARLQTTLQQCIDDGRIDDALTELKQYFLQARQQIAADSMLYRAGVAMTQANGNMPVSEVAAAAHATVRTLQRKFKQSSGHTVKDVSDLMRFEQVRNYLWHHPNANLAGLALELGYADQSHLSKEFKRYSGITPAAFARKTKKAKQAFTNDFVAFIQV